MQFTSCPGCMPAIFFCLVSSNNTLPGHAKTTHNYAQPK
jgi:hypothetical protein